MLLHLGVICLNVTQSPKVTSVNLMRFRIALAAILTLRLAALFGFTYHKVYGVFNFFFGTGGTRSFGGHGTNAF